MRRTASIIAVCLLLLAGVLLWRMRLPVETIVLQAPDGRQISLQVEVASTPAEQSRGLMFRRSVTRGMLFVFEGPRPLSFWMKDTLVPLDALFFDAQGAFLNAETMEPCRRVPCRVYLSRGAASYVLEEPAGFAQKEGVGVGWKLIPEKE